MERKYYQIGQRPSEVTLHVDGTVPLRRTRLPLTKRHWLQWRARYNEKTLQTERRLDDKRPLWWTLALLALLIVTPFMPNSVISAVAAFCLYSAINILWSLVIGTAGIFSLATLAVVGLAGYAAAAANVYLGVPWPLMFPIGALVGLLVGVVLALPSTRLDGLYYALLSLGFSEICRVFIIQLKPLAGANGSINGVDSFIPDDWFLQRPGLLLTFGGAFLLMLFALLIFRLVNSERLGLHLQTAREEEAFAEAVGIDYRRARLKVFLISSAALGVIGAFYAMIYASISPSIFSLDQMMLLFSMMVIGGLGRAEGAVVGTALVVFIDKVLVDLGPLSILVIASLMLIITLTSNNGIVGIREQFRNFRKRKMSEARARRTEKGGEVMPEEAVEIADKQHVYHRRFDKRLRDRLKSYVTPEIIEEHRAAPLGNHSDALARILNYFRRGEMPDKYGLLRQPDNFHRYKIVAFSGVRGAAPRVVDDAIHDGLDNALHAVFLLRIHDLMNS